MKTTKHLLFALFAALALAGITACVSDAPASSAPVASPAPTAAPVAAPAPAPAASAAAPATPAAAAATPAATWSVSLKGIREDTLTAAYYEEAKVHASHYVKKTVDKKGVAVTYEGMPLRLVIAMVDGPDAEHRYLFDEALWKAGYDVTLIARDGYSATFNTKDLAPDALIIADREDGKPIAPMTVGDAAKSLWVKDLVRIETSLAPSALAAAAAEFSLELSVNGAEASYTLAELETLPFYVEDKGAYTTSAGTRYEGIYGGVRLLDLLSTYAELGDDDSVTFVAMDGYEMSYPGRQVMDRTDGDWILAFRLDGEWLPKDPGYVRTIKVGPGTPNIDGHLSVKMVKKIVVKQKDFVDFSIGLTGRMSWTLDRSTIQSCVSCHTQTVTFERKGVTAEYTGFPLWMLLGYIDDPTYAPHKQDKAVKPYDDAAAAAGYAIDVKASDGFTVTLDSRAITRNDGIILALYKAGEKLPEGEGPLVLVWDRAATVPEGIKNVKMIASIGARF